MLQALSVLAIKVLSSIVHHTFCKMDKWAKKALTQVHSIALVVMLGCVVALDWALATGTSIPVLSAILSLIDGALGPIDEIIMAAWPTYRILYEVAVRWIRWLESKGIELPVGLKELAQEIERKADKAHHEVVGKVAHHAQAESNTSQ